MDLKPPDLSQSAAALLSLAEKQLTDLMKEIGTLERKRLALDAQAQTFRKVVESLRELLNAPQYAAKALKANGQIDLGDVDLADIVGDRVRTGEALLMVMKAEPGRARKPGDWLVKLRERGLIDTRMAHQREAVRSALNKLAEKRRSGVGRVPETTLYAYSPPKEVTALDKG